MNEVEKSIVEFCEEKTKQNWAIYLSDIIKHLRYLYSYTISESILIIDECIANEYLEIKSIVGLYDIDGKDDIKEVISNRIKKCCSRTYGFGIYHQIENLNNEER